MRGPVSAPAAGAWSTMADRDGERQERARPAGPGAPVFGPRRPAGGILFGWLQAGGGRGSAAPLPVPDPVPLLAPGLAGADGNGR